MPFLCSFLPGIGAATAVTLTVTGATTLATLATTGAASFATTVSIASGGSGSVYNTADQTTNYERARMFWTGNVFKIKDELGGTGTAREMRFESQDGYYVGIASNALTTNAPLKFTIDDNELKIQGRVVASTTMYGLNLSNNGAGGIFIASSGVQKFMRVSSDVNQSGTAGYVILDVNAGETTLGSGAKQLIVARVNSTNKFVVDNTGTVDAVGGLALHSPPADKTADYTLTVDDFAVIFDTTLGVLVANLPAAASNRGKIYAIRAKGINLVTIDPSGAETIDGAATLAVVAGTGVMIMCNGTGWVKLST